MSHVKPLPASRFFPNADQSVLTNRRTRSSSARSVMSGGTLGGVEGGVEGPSANERGQRLQDAHYRSMGVDIAVLTVWMTWSMDESARIV